MKFDAIVIGGGPSGSSIALALAQQGRSIAIVERTPFPRRKVCGEFISAIGLELLDRLGVGGRIRALAGPEVKRIALFSNGKSVGAEMPAAGNDGFGRALGREVLDAVLIDAAHDAGARIFQPWRATEICREGEWTRIEIETRMAATTILAPVIIGASGSWERGLLSRHFDRSHHPDDLFGIKGHFRGSSLPPDLMPLIVFPGGYGGLVSTDRNRVSFSCCIRRDALADARVKYPRTSAAESVLSLVLSSCPDAAKMIGNATLEGKWLTAGPIRPGIRTCFADDVFRVGNLAGEAHPIIAEGLSMAIQSSWMLADSLAQSPEWDRIGRISAGEKYRRAWRAQFNTRVRVASVVSGFSMVPTATAFMRSIVRAFPSALSLGATLSGKTRALPRSYL